MTGLRHLLLDLDDTLIDTATASYRAWSQLAAATGIEAPSREAFDLGYRTLTFGECFDRWLAPAGRLRFDEFSARYWKAVRYRPIGDVPALVTSLRGRGLSVGIVTHSDGDEALVKLASAGIGAELFDYVQGRPDRCTQAPPAKDLAGLLRARGLPPRACAYVSDNPADAGASTEAGLGFRGVLTGVFTRADFAAAGVPDTHVQPDVHLAVRDVLAS
jgi:phosphoglycolate phosphatase-like HAD superfamily hydrolase